MRRMKWAVCLLFVLASLLGMTASAEEPTFNTVFVHMEFTKPAEGSEELAFSLYQGEEAVSSKTVKVSNGATSFNMEFAVPEYKIGEMFRLELTEGAAAFGFIEPLYREIYLQTYLAFSGGKVTYQTAFYLSFSPEWKRSTAVMLHKKEAPAPYFPYGEDVYVSEAAIAALHINVLKLEDSVFLSSETGGYTMQFFRDNIYACRGGVGYNLEYPVFCIGENWYLPLREIGEYFACSYAVEMQDEAIVHTVRRSAYATVQENEEYVNSRDIESRTDYLIWISKKDFTVNLYIGENKAWEIVKSMPCTIGAPHTPTIEGEFEYIERIEKWYYPSYYCGPVMRFHNGYAIHSTLIRNDGTPYDNRVGMQLSLGCIRLRPEDINWLIETAPMYTKIIVTP